MYNNQFTSMLTAAEATLLHHTLNEYTNLVYVNILGLELDKDENALVEQRDSRIAQAMIEMHICITSQLSMSDAQCESIWGMFQDAIDQYDISDGEIGALETEDDRAAAIHICKLITSE